MSSLSPRPPRFRPAVLALVFVIGLAALPLSAAAQYMYLDSNGDGVNTAADAVNPTGTTTIDVYLVTDKGRDGVEGICPYESDPLDISSYTVTLRATGGSVTWGTPLNRVPEFGVNFGYKSSETEMFFGKGGSFLPPGTYRLMTTSAAVMSGAPEIQIVTAAPTLTGFAFTSFGSRCIGLNGDNTLKLGTDWFDIDGLPIGSPEPPNSSPTLAPIQNMSVLSGERGTQIVTGTDPDGQILATSTLEGPSYMSFTTLVADRGVLTGRIDLNPTRADIGSATGMVGISDGQTTSSGSFAMTVTAGPDHLTQLAPIGDLSVTCGRILTEPISARDPDGEVLTFGKVSGPSFLTVTTLANGLAAAQGLLRLAPAICDAGTHDAVVAVGAGTLSQHAVIRINVELPLRISGDLDRRFDVGGSPAADFATSDFNRDGNVDLAVVGGLASGFISVLLSDGNGSFGARTDISGIGYSLRIRAGDWNEDGKPDLATIDFGNDQVATFTGGGDGSFAPWEVLPTGGRPQDFLVADLDVDGRMDIVVANSSSSFVSIFPGKPGGGFAPRVDIPIAGSAFCVTTADLNSDGRLDLAVGTFAGRSVSIHLGAGGGSFGDATVLQVPADPYTISAADVNEDGVSDLVVTDYDGAVVVLVGDGSGAFTPRAPITGFAISPTASLADLDGDGHVDLVIATPSDPGEVTALFGDGGGGFPIRSQLSSGFALRVALMDVNGDAIPDLVRPGGGPQSVLVRLNTIGAGTAVESRAFLKDPNRTRPGAGGSPFCLRVEPVNESYSNSDVNYSSLALISEGTGSVSRITATPAKNIIEGDTDGNGVSELAACFSGADVAKLFDQVNGRRTVHVSLEGAVTNGRRFCSGFDMTVVGTGGHLAATVTPNPLNPSGVLTFRTARDGYVRVRMFDLNGRLVRVLADHPLATAGDQEIRIDGRGAHGETLASGAYFYFVETPEGKTRGRIMILK